NVRPVLFDKIGDAIESNLQNPLLSGLGPCAISGGIVEGRYPGCCAISDNLRKIEGIVRIIGGSKVRASNDESSDRINRTLDDSTTTQRVITGVFMRDDWNHSLREDVAIHIVGELMPIITPVSSGAVTKLRVR